MNSVEIVLWFTGLFGLSVMLWSRVGSPVIERARELSALNERAVELMAENAELLGRAEALLAAVQP